MDSIKQMFCCCNEPPQAPVQPSPPPPPPVVKKEDCYLDADDPVEAIMESPQIQALTLASVEFFLNDQREVGSQFSTGNDQQAKEFRKAIALAKKENPDACTSLMRELLALLPKKKSIIRKNTKTIATKGTNPYISEMNNSKGFQRKPSNKVANTTGNTNLTGYSNSSDSKLIEPSTLSIRPKVPPGEQTADKIKSTNPKATLQFIDIEMEQNKTGSAFLDTKKKKELMKITQEKAPTKTESTIDPKSSGIKAKPHTLEPIKKPPLVKEQQPEEHQQFKNKFDQLLNSEEDFNLKIIKAFVFLYTSPYIYRDLNKKLTQKRYDNYTKIVAFVMDSLKKLPEEAIKDFKLPFTTGFSMYRGLKTAQLSKLNKGYWKAFTSCTLKKSIAEQFASRETGGCLLQIQFKPPVHHMYIKVPNSTQFTFFDQSQVILFPFFQYEVLERNKEKSKYVVREVKEQPDYQQMDNLE